MTRLGKASRLAIVGAVVAAGTALAAPAASAATLGVSISCDSGASRFFCHANVSGGVAPFTYQWNPPVGTGSSIHGGCAGGPFFAVSVTVTDATGARASDSGGQDCNSGPWE